MMFEGGPYIAKEPMKKAFDPDATVRIEANEEELLMMRINELKKRKEGIFAFKDVVPEDRAILEEIDHEIAQLEEQISQSKESVFDKEKRSLFTMIDRMGGAYSASHDRDYSPEEIKELIEKVLSGDAEITVIPKSPIFGSTDNVRDKVKHLLEVM